MNREVQQIVLILVGAAVLKISLGEAYLRYVKPGMQPYLWAAGAVLVLLGALAVWRETRAPDPYAVDHDEPSADGAVLGGGRRAGSGVVEPVEGVEPVGGGDGSHAGADHDHGHAGPRVAWLLLVPVLAIFVIAPPALGADAASRDAGTALAPSDADEDFEPLPDGDPVELTVLDYATRAAWGGEDTLEGRRVSMSGFVTPRPEGGWFLTRIALSCCAADGFAIKVEVRDAPDLPADTWVEVVGSYAPSPGGEPTEVPSVVVAEQVSEVAAPANPYLG